MLQQERGQPSPIRKRAEQMLTRTAVPPLFSVSLQIGKPAVTRMVLSVVKTWPSFQLLTILLSSFFFPPLPPCWAAKILGMKKKQAAYLEKKGDR